MGRKLTLSEVIDVVSDSLVGGVIDKEGKLTPEEIRKLEDLKDQIGAYVDMSTAFLEYEHIKSAVEKARNK